MKVVIVGCGSAGIATAIELVNNGFNIENYHQFLKELEEKYPSEISKKHR